MVKMITRYLDNQQREHETEEAAKRAEERYLAEQVLEKCFEQEDLTPLEGVNTETLQPLANYIARLIRESDARTEKYG